MIELIGISFLGAKKERLQGQVDKMDGRTCY